MQFSEQEFQNIIKNFIAEPSVQNALALRQCAFRPEGAFQINVNYNANTYDIVMRPEAKALWFQTWCAERAYVGHMECQTEKVEVIGDKLLVIASAKVYIDSKLVSSDVGSRAAMLTDPNSLDAAAQMAASYAKGRALSNAGFGACCSKYDIPIPSDNGMNSGSAPSGGETLPLPFTMPTGSWDQPSVPQQVPAGPVFGQAVNGNQQYGFQGSDPGQQMNIPGVNPGWNGQPAPAQQPVGNMNPVMQDPIAAAKAMVWPVNGAYRGRTLGEILTIDPKLIIRQAKKVEDASLKQALTLLLPEANGLCGK